MGCVGFITAMLLSRLQGGADAFLSFLQSLAVGRVWNLINLGQNATTLAQQMRQLRAIRDHLVGQVQPEEIRPRMKRNPQVADWIKMVDELENEVGVFRASFEGRRTCLEGCSFESVYFNYELGQKAADLLKQLSERKSERGDLGGELVVEGPPPAVESVRCPAIVGAKKMRSDIRRCLQDDGIGVIGICGMGGVGKTTCLAEINNEFLMESQSNDFEVVIWVTVSKDVNIPKIQEEIGVRLGFRREGLPTDETDRRKTVQEVLRQKQFLLLLDDLWGKLDLEKIGIPHPANNNQRKSKVVFTTRSRDVCAQMDARIVEADTLDEEASWNLFCSKVGAEVNLSSSTLQPLAEAVVRRCGGLPLALVTVGRAMAGKASISEWEDALHRLRESPEEVRGLEEEVFSILKFSFDMLKDDSMRYCLLYCSLYREDEKINTEGLIEYWAGEGFLDKEHSQNLDKARRRGRLVIDSLKAASLLESAGREDGVDYVKMHDVVRDMALWLTDGEHGDKTNIFVVDRIDERSSGQVQNMDRWERATRISMLSGSYQNVGLPDKVPRCPNLRTLLMRRIQEKQLVGSDGFIFKFMPALRVLDLSDTGIEELPKEIGLLVELRYLNLSGTGLRSLPRELGKLVRLRQLILRGVWDLERVPAEAILGLVELQRLDLYVSGYGVISEHGTEAAGADDDREITLSDMEHGLDQLEELGINISGDVQSLDRLLASKKLSRGTRFLSLNWVSKLRTSHLNWALEAMVGLRELHVSGGEELEELSFSGGRQLPWLEVLWIYGIGQARILAPIPPNRVLQRLRQLTIWRSHGFKDLTWIRYLPCLEVVELWYCRGLEELIRAENGSKEGEASGSGVEDNYFPSLRVMWLSHLPRLRIISKQPMLLPSLTFLGVSGCPELKKLPLGTHSAKKLNMIRGEKRWWDQLEWDSGTRDKFQDRFVAGQ